MYAEGALHWGWDGLYIQLFAHPSGRNSATEEKIPHAVLTRSFDFGFPVAGACKDIGLAIEECQAMGLPMIVGSAARQLWQFAYNQGGAMRDMTTLVTYLEPWAGVEVRGRALKIFSGVAGARHRARFDQA